MFPDMVVKWADELSPQPIAAESEPEATVPDETAPPVKKAKVMGICAKYLQKQIDNTPASSSSRNTVRSQFERYVKYDHAIELDESGAPIEINPLKFWQNANVVSEMPALSKLALRVLTVPASSAPVERLFSHGGIIFRPHRRKMADSNLSQLIFLKVNRLK